MTNFEPSFFFHNLLFLSRILQPARGRPLGGGLAQPRSPEARQSEFGVGKPLARREVRRRLARRQRQHQGARRIHLQQVRSYVISRLRIP